MQAVILAGGKGTRLNPYTAILPKPLVPIGGHPILEIILRQLKYSGIKEIIISTGHLASLIEAYFADGKKIGVSIRYVRERTPLNTAGCLGIIPGLDKNFIVMNGDIFTKLDYKDLFSFHKRIKGAATIAVNRRHLEDPYGVIKINAKSELEDYIEKPTHTYLIRMGVNVISRRCLDYIRKGEPLSMPEFIMRMKENKEKIYCYQNKKYWLDIGNREDFQRAQEYIVRHKDFFLK